MVATSKPTLYWYPCSLCAMIVRFGIGLQQSYSAPGEAFDCNFRVVDIGKRGEQSEEWYLTTINPKGLVPALIGAAPTPLLDSKDICIWLGETNPFLRPHEYASDIDYLVHGLHTVKYATLTFYGLERRLGGIVEQLEARLATPGISDEYRRLLVAKVKFTKDRNVSDMGGFDKNGKMSPESLAMAEDSARVYLGKAASIIEANSNTTPWIFPAGPTIGDPNLAVLTRRLLDIGRGYLVPDVVKEKVNKMVNTPEWMAINDGKSTLPAYIHWDQSAV